MQSKLKERESKESKEVKMKKYLSPQEVEQIYGISQKWLANMRWEKKWIPYHKIGGKILYKPEDIESFIEQRKVKVIEE